MNDNPLWNSVKLVLPKKITIIDKKGKLKLKEPLTKKNNISKSLKKPSIKLELGPELKLIENDIKTKRENISIKSESKSFKLNNPVDSIINNIKTDTINNKIIDSPIKTKRENISIKSEKKVLN